ncbi:MAG: flagellar basal-body MS-ring/collar protein FliF [Sedimentisphaerales bacterium]
MNFFQKIEKIWQNVSLVQRALLMAIVLTFIAVGVLITYWARRPDMGLLYSGLDAEEAAKIVDKISEKNITYKLASGGTSIYVPKENISQLRLDMAKEGLPEGGQKGYGIFDNEKIGISPFVQNVNLNRALQEELAKSIQMIDGVVRARIHIVSPERNLFNNTTKQTSASVVLRLKSGYRLSGLNIAAITHLVASGVEGLKPENITIVDSQGRLLSTESDQAMGAGIGTVVDYKERVEQGLAGKVEEMLTAVLGPGRASVKVSAEIDMNSTNLVTKSYDATGVVVKEEIKEKSKTPGSSVSAGGASAATGGKETDNTITTNKVFGEKTQTISELPGEIKSLTVAAFVDLYPTDPNAKDLILAEGSVVGIIKNALGLKDANSIKVVNARFSRPTLIDVVEPKKLDIIAIAGQASLGIMAVCALLVLKMFNGAKKKAVLMPATATQLPAAGAEGLLTAGIENPNPSMLRRQVANSLRNNPEQAKQLFSSWLDEKGS